MLLVSWEHISPWPKIGSDEPCSRASVARAQIKLGWFDVNQTVSIEEESKSFILQKIHSISGYMSPTGALISPQGLVPWPQGMSYISYTATWQLCLGCRCEPLAKRVNSRPPLPLPPRPFPFQQCHLCVIMAAVQLYKIMRRMWPHNEWTSGHWATKRLAIHNFCPTPFVWFCVGSLLGRLKIDQTPRAATELHQTFAISRHNNDNKIGHYKTWRWYGTLVRS